MSSASIAPDQPHRKVGDAFATGVLAMLLLNLVQRVVGLLRGLGFCHYLSDVQLGQWALVNSFLMIAVPIAVLGLPGSFSRFVETFRSRQQLGGYFRRVLVVSLLGLTLMCLSILAFPQQFSWLIFREPTSYSVVVWCVVTLISLTIFSFVHELVAAVREVRAVSLMQFIQSVVFGVVGLAILSVQPSWNMLLPSFSIACLLATVPGVYVILSGYRAEFRWVARAEPIDGRSLWGRILPYAFALWVMNLLSNLFEVSDRYMLLHLVSGVEQAGQALVGQYHCGRILPNLLTSIALMLGGVLLPYISADWEAGQSQRIAARLRQVMQSISIGFTALAIAAMCVAPALFYYGFQDRYQQAEAILPMSLVQAIWASLFFAAQSYLLCIERGRRLAVLMIVGLVLNLALNWWLIQEYGLFGAVLATSLANLVTLLLLLWQMSGHGCWMGWGTVALCVTPLSVAGGPIVAAITLTAIVFVAGRTDWLLSAADRQQIDAALLPRLHSIGIRLSSLWRE